MSATMSFGIQRIDRKDFQVLSVSGYMGNNDCAKLECQLEHLFEQGHRQVILDFAALTFVTSASLSRLAKQARWFVRERGTILLSATPSSVRDLVKLAGVDHSLVMVGDLATAIKFLAAMEPPAVQTAGRTDKHPRRPRKPVHRDTRSRKATEPS